MSAAPASRKWLYSSILIFILVLAWLVLMVPEPETKVQKETILLPVSVVPLQPQNYQVQVNASGITQARWPTRLVAAVDGRISELSARLEPGVLVNDGQLLLKIQDSQYQAQLDSARSRLANAQLNLEKTLHEQTVAQRSGGKLRTPYARYEPQVASAQADVKAATSELKNAQQRLKDTEIHAPFAAIILQRLVTPGQWLPTSSETFVIAASDSIDIKVEMPESDWAQLPQLSNGNAVSVATNNGEQWQGKVRYISPVREKSTRQRSLIVKVDSPYQPQQQQLPLLPDTQVDLTFNGNEQQQVFVAPASVLTEDGNIWSVNAQNLLQQEEVELLAQSVEQVVVRFKQQPQQPRQVVLYPLGSMINGQQVMPQPTSVEAVQ
ncbi:efflux RND transporter periplasmic adaptor subunit [Bacterioplanoides sp.]|uniref:efflux RND transporter periplasmic adaptor subunit n=1 Tax=Bacterioplanoides sp. TaxID=2066072 RepID=UPI003B5BDB0C